jgi:nitroimidazol reductase NimA-like FMN-containing flavoprotein (pyridoxamine 5'-phosphate oxidase superfamily)
MVCRQDCEFFERARFAALLQHAKYGFIATSAGDQRFLNPDLLRYDRSGQRIDFHTAIEGCPCKNIEHNPQVRFSLAEIGRRLPADSALECSNYHISVIGFGNRQLVESEPEWRDTVQGLLANYAPELKPDLDFRGIAVEELGRTSIPIREIGSWIPEEKSAAL